LYVKGQDQDFDLCGNRNRIWDWLNILRSEDKEYKGLGEDYPCQSSSGVRRMNKQSVFSHYWQ